MIVTHVGIKSMNMFTLDLACSRALVATFPQVAQVSAGVLVDQSAN